MFDSNNRQKTPEKEHNEKHACCDDMRSLLHRSLNGIIILDADQSICYANPAAEEIFGCTSAMLLGKTFAFAPEQGKSSEISITRHDGRETMVELWGMETEWNRTPAWLVSLQDVTERKRNEQELRKMYRAVLDSPVMVVITDALGTIEYVNPKFTESMGYSFAEAVGGNLCDRHLLEAPQDVYQLMWETVNNGNEWRGELIGRRKNGERFFVSLSIASIESIDGTISNFVVIVQDITERKQYEEELRSSERQLAEAQKIAHLGSWKRYLDTGKSYWSDELYRIFGLEPGSVTPSHEQFLAMVHPEDREKVRLMARDSLKEMNPFSSYYCRIVRPDGSIRILLGQGEIVNDADGSPLMFIGTALDITERKLMEEQIEKLNTALEARAAALEAANRELESFSYTVCHDLRSPLTNIHGYSQVLSELCREQLDEQCRGYLREISRGTERMNELIETLLDFSLVSRGELTFDEVNLSDLASEIAAELQLEEPERRVEFRIAEDVMVRGDERLLRIMLRNLIGNAWKYSAARETAMIEFGALDIAGVTSCYVRDNGIGFDRKDAKKLFAPFQRLHEAGVVKGHGIGLATVQRIVERHGGRVWAEGEQGKGATFFFTL